MKITDIKEGDLITLDGGFTCAKAGQVLVHKDSQGLFFQCDEGHHYIEGQLDEECDLIGITASY